MKYILLVLIAIIPFMSFAQKDLKGNVLKKLLKANPEHFQAVLKKAKRHHLQIIYTQIERDAQNVPTFRSYAYNENPTAYFYPASLVKLPVAALVLEKIREIQTQIPPINPHTTVRFGASRPAQVAVIHDSTSPTGLPTLAHYIKKSLLVSDNDAFNRLYEFLGQEYIQRKLAGKGYTNTLISQRLSRPIFEEEEERHTNPCAFVVDSQVVWQQKPLYNALPHVIKSKKMKLGKAYYKKGELINKPYNFKGRNFIPLAEMQTMLRAILFPESVPATQRFALQESDYQWLWKSMGMYPRESATPIYNGKEYTDNFMKYYLRDTFAPSNTRILNKVGMAFGFLIDNAYIIDFQHHTEYMLSVVIYANADETLNDDKYEYETVSKPFMQNLAAVISEYEKTRTHAYKSDLSKFKLLYKD